MPTYDRTGPQLPVGAVATIVVYESGVEVNLRRAMPVPQFVALLRKIADSYEDKTIRMTRP
jgi:hypothetical protein